MSEMTGHTTLDCATSDDWKREDRSWKPKRRIGGSDAPKLLGISPYGDSLDVYNRIVNEVEIPWSKAMERGAAMEPVLRARAQTALGLMPIDRKSDIHEHKGNDFSWAQIDDVVMRHGSDELLVADYKTQNKFARNWGLGGTDDVPEHIACQLAWEMACADLDKGLVVVGFGEDVDGPEIFRIDRLCMYELERNGPYESFLMATAKTFWDEHVIPRVPPIQTKRGKRKP